MAEITKSLSVDVAKKNTFQAIVAKQGDTASRFLKIQLMNEGEPISVDSSSSVTINARRSDEQSKTFLGSANADGTVTVPLTQWMLAIDGLMTCSVTVVDSSSRKLSTTSFNVNVEFAECESEEISEDDNYDILVALLADVSEVKEDTEQATTDAIAAKEAANTAAAAANAAVSDYNTAKANIETAVASIESANVTATADAAKATTAKNEAVEAAARAEASEDALTEQYNTLSGQVALKADNLYFNTEDGKLYLMSDGEVIGDGVTVATSGGGSGSGSSNSAVLTVTNTTGWLSKTIAEDSACVLSGTWSSIEDEIATGNGVLTVKVANVVKSTSDIAQGAFSVDVADYLTTGSNAVKISITDVYGNTRTINFTVTVASISLSSTFDASVAYDGAITYTYIPKGSVSKTVHFILDGTELETTTVTTSGRQQTYSIAAQTHGSHKFEVYFTATIDGQAVESNHLYYDLICVESGDTTPIIACAYNTTSVKQYETINIPYIVYDPASLTASVNLAVNGTTASSLTVNRTEQTWAYRADSTGSVSLTITCGTTVKTIALTVAATEIDATAETSDLDLYLTSYGRSNNEANPASWSYGSIACTFAGYNWSSDGWQTDDDGITVHRVSGDARLTIPLKIFENDFRTTGKTIEIEFATKDVLDYDSVILSCYAGNKGLQLTAQKALLKSEQSELSTQYKENEHIRLTFVVEKKSENRLIYIYLNGIICGATQYPADDDFSQSSPVGITIGSNNCTIDIYNIRVYSNDLTRYQVLENWIADTQDIDDKIDRYNRNNIYDDYGAVTIEKLPDNLPYLVLQATELPQYKGNKVTVSGEYVDSEDSSNSFEFSEAQADVQGTSSAGYARKNYKIKFKNGFTQNGVSGTGYKLRSTSIATSTFTFKADVASSEGANNVELVRLYNDICPYKTPPQELDGSIRQGIDGKPIVIFHNNGSTMTFVGKYNFNNDKGTPEVYGFASGDESWEILNNTSDRVLFKSADFTGEDWKNDFEARYPEDNTDTTNLAAFAAWVASTDQTAATNEALTTAVTYDGTEYTTDTAAYRLAKFKAELSSYAELDSAVFYYLFTELFLMVDSRAKNAFPSKFGTDKICWLPYDMDTAIGINNEGSLVFSYALEDTDKTSDGADVYNGQQSVFWKNLREAFGSEIKAMYQELRSDGKLSYTVVEEMFENHQKVWSEAIWNEDAYYKYLQPLIESGTGIYLPMLQGSKSEQRKWWLYNRFRYIDSKYNAGDSLSDIITLRGYAVGNITIEPYADIYATAKYGSYLVQTRALRGSTYTLTCPLDTLNDTEIYIYSASQLKSVGDLSSLKVGLADFSMATKLQTLKLGDSDSTYSNGNLNSLTLGNNVLLQTLDVRNCTSLGTGEQQSVDLSGCTNIENVYFDGTAVKGVSLPNGGILKVLHLPATITNLTVCNQSAITDFTLPSYANIATLRLENVNSKIDSLAILKAISANSRVRLIGIDWSLDTYADAEAVYDILDTMRGLDENGNNTDKAQVAGTIHIPSVTGTQLEELKSRYSSIAITYDTVSYFVYYKDSDGTLLYTDTVAEGANAIDPVTTGAITAPAKEATDDVKYTYTGWGTLPTNIHANQTVTAQYSESYAVRFYNGSTLLETDWIASGGTATYNGSTPTKSSTAQYTYTFSGWSSTDGGSASSSILKNIKAAKSVYAAYTSTVRTYTVRFYNGITLLQTSTVAYGSSASYTGSTPVSTEDETETFTGWNPSPTSIKGDTDCYAVFKATNALDNDTWKVIAAHADAGEGANYYSIGDCKGITLNGTVGTLSLDNITYYVYIIGFNHDGENNIRFGTFKTAIKNGVSIGLVDSYYNSNSTGGTKYFNMNHWGNYNYGGWAACDMRYDILGSTDVAPSGYGSAKTTSTVGYDATTTCATNPVANTLMAAFPADLRAVMKPMTIYTDNKGNASNIDANVTTTIDYLPLLSEYEIFGSRSYANQYEKDHQTQYAYYSAGNSKVKYKHSSTSSSACWWERSANCNGSSNFCFVYGDGYAYRYDARWSFAVAPAFSV